MKIGIYAGTFDPIHEGHIAFAEGAIKQAGLERVVIVAEKSPYRKQPHASWDHRQAMIERATEDIASVDHDYQFANQLAHQHTMNNMLTVAKQHYGSDTEIWFLVGSDIFEHIARWEEVVGAEQYGGFVVALKHDHTNQWLKQKLESIKNGGLELTAIIISHQHGDTSSSEVRSSIAANQATAKVSKQVLGYIQMHQLYR